MSLLPALPLAYYVDNFSPFLGPHWHNFGIRYYGLAYLLAFAAAYLALIRYARAGRSLLPAAKVGDFMVYVVLGTLLGGRLGYFLLYRPDSFLAEPLAIFRVWEGGMASHGGMLGVTIALIWFGRAQRIPILHLGDLVVSIAPIGLLFGRLANFINGELWGKISFVRWAVIFPNSISPGTPLALIPPRHPSQLYEAALEGIFLLAFMQWRFWRGAIVRTQPGRLSGEFFFVYAFLRIAGERFREPDASLILGLSRGTFYSVFLIFIGLGLILHGRRQARTI
jgi:phosphatidylglycerol:prolipoprotein diacylglycerol transferase